MESKEFKKWLIENDFEKNKLFRESLICYNNGAYRASYVMSYVGFLGYLIDYAKDYDGYPIKYCNAQAKWDEIKKNLRNDESKEKAINDLINMAGDNNIFQFTDDMREKFKEKRCRRNDCVHNKTQGVTSATVEDLWDFIVYIKPLAVINGTEKHVEEKIMDILQFSPSSQYKNKSQEIYRFYQSLVNEKKKVVFKKICELALKKIKTTNQQTQFFIDLFEQMYQKKECEEYEWVKEWSEVEFFIRINVENYRSPLDKSKLYELCNQSLQDEDKEYFRTGSIYTILGYGEKTDLKVKFLNEAYNEENNFILWVDLLLHDKDWKKLLSENSDLMEKVTAEKNLTIILNNIKKMYKYKTSYDQYERDTETFDYCKLCYDNCLTRQVILILWLVNQQKISKNDDVDELILRVNTIKKEITDESKMMYGVIKKYL